MLVTILFSLFFCLLSKKLKTKIYNTIIILPIVLYGCETWSLTLFGEDGLRVFGNRVLGKIFGPKREEMAGGWGRLHNEELPNLYSSTIIIIIIIIILIIFSSSKRLLI
jgi:hypothetical protein